MTKPARCTLYGETLWISPYVFSSFVALREKGIAFDVREIALVEGQHLAAAYRDGSLTARVPSLEHDGFQLSESSAIAEYLEEVFPPPQFPRLFPEDPRDRARARQLMAWMRSDVGTLRDDRSTVTMFYRFPTKPLSTAGARDAEKLVGVAEQVIPADGGPLFGTWCLADSELAFMLHRMLLSGDPVPGRVRKYAEAQWSRPSAQAYITHARPLEIPDGYWKFSGTPDPRK